MPYPMSVDANIPTQQQIARLAEGGYGFTYTTQINTAASAIKVGAAIFNNNSGKTVLIYSINVWATSNTGTGAVNYVTSDPALGTSMQLSNDRLGSIVTSVVSGTYSNTAVTDTGIRRLGFDTTASGYIDVLASQPPITLPIGEARGIEVFITLGGANTWGINIRGVEF